MKSTKQLIEELNQYKPVNCEAAERLEFLQEVAMSRLCPKHQNKMCPCSCEHWKKWVKIYEWDATAEKSSVDGSIS